ncbi:DNA polymerase [Panacagrimonas perspica]|uniref:Type-4 uracil-DNA glycosylase n=1 Tax=Panacagrimonas perspica TaxID=381431 RepID=A0A4R7P521_9GAMM|nr:UdgX family uracil-DNA binding protein [Panacagrimonas perspica]TDU28080.1 DNA polymerase [Panacagrimonas perspica]THD03494.1 uracil-DNA glycosylase [Panacagrimonas perspica]
MRQVDFPPGAGFEAWRDAARALLRDAVPPEDVSWTTGPQDDLLGATPISESTGQGAAQARVPREFPPLARSVLAHSDPQSPALMYRILWRLTHGEPRLLEQVTDADIVRARACEKSVHRDAHKMKAFVRFREIAAHDGEPVFVAWFEPEHYVVEQLAPFFAGRFAGMRWSILTPYRSAHWDGQELSLGPGALRSDAPQDDVLEDLWRTYYASIFNPARLKVKAMTQEMPQKYWKNLPEARLIPGLVREAAQRRDAMVEQAFAAPNRKIRGHVAPEALPVPTGSLDELRRLAHDCRRCDLWKPATQTVFGEGPAHARVMVIGEQPGDQEDLAGKPFIGPAGKLLDSALEQAGLDRADLYVTNTVKHFKFEPRGKTRLHKRADAYEQQACRPWLDAEIERVKPDVILCLGSMAASAMLGSSFKLLKQRGTWHTGEDGSRVIATVHPSYLLRLPDASAREQGFADFVTDLRQVADALAKGRP